MPKPSPTHRRRSWKLIIQIPCYNEARTLGDVVRSLPRSIEGVDCIEVLVIDDGSTDGTVEVAQSLGVDHIVRHTRNQGLARTFRTGLDACLQLGADVIVNTDGDNQYDARDIEHLIRPILDGVADVVVGDRQTQAVEHFSRLKKFLQSLGSGVVRALSGTDVRDAVSGFRALSRHAAIHLNIVSSFSYTIEMLIQAGRKGMAVVSVPIRTNRPTRPSRLFKSLPHFLARSLTTMVRMYAMYKPLATFMSIGGVILTIGTIPVVRFLYFWSQGDSMGHVQSLVLGGVLITLGAVTLLVGLVADLINFNRQLVELTLAKVRILEIELPKAPLEVSKTSRPDDPNQPAALRAAERSRPHGVR